MIICRLCSKRRARRACPAVHGDICAICCGEQRETTLFCPLDCEFLREAHKHEKTLEVPIEQISNKDVEVREEFLAAHEQLLMYVVYALVRTSLKTTHAMDTDVMEALAALIRTRKTAQSGLIYETRPENVVARSIQQQVAQALEEYADELRKTSPLAPSPEGDIFKILVFLHRIGQQNLNGRPKGRMFIGLLQEMVPDAGVQQRAPSIIL